MTSIKHDIDAIQWSSEMYDAIDTSTETSLISFLERPIIIDSGTLNTTDVVGTFTGYDLFPTMTTNSMFAAKLKGFLGIKADVELKLTVNAQKFQAGRYMLCAVPLCGKSNVYNTQFVTAHTANLTARTQVPHVELDVNCESSAVMNVPFISPLAYFPLGSTTRGLISHVRLFPYSALTTGDATYTVWARFKNIKLFGPALPQSGKVRFKSVQAKEQDQSDIGPVSAFLSRVALASNELGKIPLLTTFTRPVGFVSEILANTAKIFGWAKPLVVSPPHPMVPTYSRYLTNYDGADCSYPLSLSSNNEVTISPNGATNLDEMAFDYVKTIPAYYSSFVLSTSDTRGSNIYNQNVGGDMSVSHTYASTTCYTFLPATFPSTIFRAYRGSFNLHLKCVKTAFHTGRISISAVPNAGYDVSTGTYSFADSVYLLREIIDLSSGNEWVFNVPYCGSTMWRRSGDTNYNYCKLYIDVVDTLEAASTVSSSVTFLVEWSGGPDLEYASPIGTTYQPIAIATPQSAILNNCKKYFASLGDSKEPKQSQIPAATCMGEKFTSYRQVVKRLTVSPRLSFISDVTSTYLRIVPFAMCNSYVDTGTVYGNHSADMYTLIASMYGMATGSVRIGLAGTNDMASVNPGIIAYLNPMVYGSSLSSFFGGATSDNYGSAGPRRLNGNLLSLNPSNLSPLIMEVQVPSYVGTPGWSLADTWANAAACPTNNVTAPTMALNITGFLKNSSNESYDLPTVMRGGADDLHFSCFISTIPMYDIGPDVAGTFAA